MKAIFVTGIDYESPIQIGDHNLARQFARDGWQVAFLSIPITPFHIFSKNHASIKRKYNNFKSGGYIYKVGDGTIWSFVPGALVTPKNNSFMRLQLYRSWHKFIHPGFTRLLKQHGFYDVDLIFIRDTLQAFILDSIRHGYSIYRMADNDAGFESYNSSHAFIEKYVAQRVNLVLYTAKELERRAKELNPKQSMFLPNGVDWNHFDHADKSRPQKYLNIHTPIVVYAGSIDYWFDFDLLNTLTKEMPDYSFVMIGPNEQSHNRFVFRKNLHFIGSVKYDQLPAYLYNATLGIIPFDVNKYPDLVNSINPIKLYEYMACGLPVVATNWNELRTMHSPAVLCSTKEEYIQSIRNIAENSQLKKISREFAEKYDWGILYKRLMAKIGEIA